MCKILELMCETFVVSRCVRVVIGYSWKDGVIASAWRQKYSLEKGNKSFYHFSTLIHNVQNGQTQYCKIFEVRLTILGHFSLVTVSYRRSVETMAATTDNHRPW